jgi:hypothetical protein
MSKLDTLPQWSVILDGDKNKNIPAPALIKKISDVLLLSPDQIKQKIEEPNAELVTTHYEKAELIQFLLKKVKVKSVLKRQESVR